MPNFPTTGYENVAIQGNYAYVVGNGNPGLSLSVFNISNPQDPYVISYLTTGTVPWQSGAPYYLNGAYNIAVSGNNAFVPSSGSSYLYVLDISNPSNPFNIGKLLITGSPGSIYGAAYQNGVVYLATQHQGLTVVDVGGGGAGGSLTAPVQTFQEGGAVQSFGVAISGSTVYTTQYSTTSPYTIRQIKSWTTTGLGTITVPHLLQSLQVTSAGEALGISISGNTAFVSTQAAGAFNTDLVNITTPASMTNLSQIRSANSFNSAFVAVANGGYLYVPSGSNATYGGAIDAYNIVNLSNPVHVSQVTTGIPNDVFGGIALSNGFIYAADYGVAPGKTGTLDVFSQQVFVR